VVKLYRSYFPLVRCVKWSSYGILYFDFIISFVKVIHINIALFYCVSTHDSIVRLIE